MAAFPLTLALAALVWLQAAAPSGAQAAREGGSASTTHSEIAQLRAEVAELRQLRAEVEELRRLYQAEAGEFRHLRAEVQEHRAKVQNSACDHFEVKGNDLVLRNMNLKVFADDKTPGVGNLIVGRGHSYGKSTNGVAVGTDNTIEGEGNFIAGYFNEIKGSVQSSILGGDGNVVNNGRATVILGGHNKHAQQQLHTIDPDCC